LKKNEKQKTKNSPWKQKKFHSTTNSKRWESDGSEKTNKGGEQNRKYNMDRNKNPTHKVDKGAKKEESNNDRSRVGSYGKKTEEDTKEYSHRKKKRNLLKSGD